VVAAFPQRFRVVALTAGNNIELLQHQIERWQPQLVSVASERDADLLAARWQGSGIEICCGKAGMIRCATLAAADMVVTAVVGAAGLEPTMAAVSAGKDVALANKETLVVAGELVMRTAAQQQATIIPVDSEHSAIYQCLAGHRREDVRRLILTASGGPFREYAAAQFAAITPADALAHPNWDMGRKITIDSATMMNKGLEIIEARWLFDFPAEKIAVHVHPESIVHSLVEYIDGALVAQLGLPDMKSPIAYALSWPERLPLPQAPLDLCRLGCLHFSEPDSGRFPCLQLAYDALQGGGTLPAVMNAANEIAVAAFLQQRIDFLGIPRTIEKVLAAHRCAPVETIEQALAADSWARQAAQISVDGGSL
jgi:1-deoxy-D-xylulose-5-phosphate reductoisomerase